MYFVHHWSPIPGGCIYYIAPILYGKQQTNACMATHRHTDLKVFICYTAFLERVILYYGFFRTEVSKLSPWELVSCRVQLQPLSNTPETANLSTLETFRQVFWGKLELNSAGHRPSRTEFGHPALEQVTSSRMGTCWFFFYTYIACYL